MRAVQILGNTSSPRITTNSSIATPVPKGAEILVRVLAAGVTGDEVTWPEVYASPSRIPGNEVSGTVRGLGPEYTGRLEVGQDVAALLAADRAQGGQAEYTMCLDEEVSRLDPTTISHVEAAALPIPILTAWEALVDYGKLAAGMTILVTGASGAVGKLAVQLALKLFDGDDIKVIALASSKNHDALKQLGVHEVHDYDINPNWEDNIDNVDLVFDTVGGEVLTKTWKTLKSNNGGTIVTVGDPAPEWAFNKKIKPKESIDHPGVNHIHFIVKPDSHRLSQALEMVSQGTIKPLEVESFPFEEAEQAWERARQRGRNKKVVITF
ncbi:uncharacterized protein PV06_00499 [Exophiala oligosperma]|uniref:Enoyl reductase (ER) domain-containing protein n=2 Tax=Chaetothyriales TaxID=34395 RepID=A0A0D2B6F6_9EURO|nr:uncharacterized protein PV06_00499 [Exophiala oligosperma]KAJ9626804.1 hypothetical protein H2204_009820 [Knufia peltigerae]KIW47841.1 hypothetical protein PV06_00499 [Exophiala oligosperma]